MPENLKKRLEKMANEVGMSQNQLTVLALHSLISSYESKGSSIFANLLKNEDQSKLSKVGKG